MARPAAVALAAAALARSVARAGRRGLEAPFRLSPRQLARRRPAQSRVLAGGKAAVAFDVQDEDRPVTSQGVRRARSAAGTAAGARAREYRRPQEVLGLAFAGGDARAADRHQPAGPACCSSAARCSVARRPVRRPADLAQRLTGTTVGARSRSPARAARRDRHPARGVGRAVDRSRAASAPARPLTSPAGAADLGAAALRGGGAVVAWTARRPGGETAGPREILVAAGTADAAPRRARVAVTVAAGHSIDELQLAGAARPTLAWVESWYDATRRPALGAVVADLGVRRVHADVSPVRVAGRPG